MPPDPLQALLTNAASAQAMALLATGERLFALDASRLGAGVGKETPDAAAPRSIALLRLHGTVTPRGGSGMEGFRAKLASARDNADVGAAIIDTDSPGGTVAGSAEAAQAVADLAAVKPVIAFVDTLAASAAYWIASQASQIWMTPSGEVGSIGIRAMHADISKMLGDMGVNVTEVASSDSPHKTEMSPFAPLSGDAQATRTAEEETEFTALGAELDTLEAEVAGLDREITSEEAAARRGALFGASSTTMGSRVFGSTGRVVNEPDPATSGGFKSLSEFAACVAQSASGGMDPRLGATTSTYNSNGGAAGEGFLVPPEYSTQIWDIAFENTDLLGMANPEPTRSNAVFKPKDETTPWGSVGVQAAWRSEGQQMTATKLAMTGELMTLHELYAFCAASQELLADAPMLQDRLTRQAGNAIRWKASDAIMYGDGAGKPIGIMKSPALITVAKDQNQAQRTVSVSNLANMAARVLRTGGKPMWLANPDVMPQLVLLTLGNVPAYMPINQPVQDSPWDGYLMGYPLMFTEHAQTLGTPGDLVCANMSGYYAATKADGVEFATSIHLFFDQGLQAFRWTFRLTGQPYLSKPVQPANGTNTKSHFVALAVRA